MWPELASPRQAAAVAGLLLLLASGEAAAYCRTRTCEFTMDGCTLDANGCSREGEFVFWRDLCRPFAVQRDGSVLDAIDAATLDVLVAEGFAIWSQVPCPSGGTPELAAQSQGLVACDAVEYDCKDGDANANIVMFRDDFIDDPYGLRLGVIALTTLTANLASGELFDADIEINSRDEDFEVDGEDVGLGVRSLRGVVNHEIGHFLGLSHSIEPGALMRFAYEGTLEPAGDDIAGMCEVLGSSPSDPICEVPQLSGDTGCVGSDLGCMSLPGGGSGGPGGAGDMEGRGCACGLVGAGGAPPRWAGWSALPLLAAWLAFARRQRRRGGGARATCRQSVL